MPKLSISRRHEFFNWVPLDPEKVEGYRLGRGRQADIKLSGHTDISREHARIFYNPEEDQWYLVDQSLFGTFLNGQRIPEKVPVKLNYGDSIRIHDYLLIFNMESSIFVADVSNVYDSPLPLRENSKFEHLISQLSERMGQLSHDGAFFVRYVAETVRRSFHVDNCFVGIYDEGGNHFEHFYNDSSDPALQGRKFRPSESFLAAVRNERRALSSLDVSNDPEFKNFETLARSRVRSAVGIPILGNAGVLYLDSRLSTLQHCTDEDLDFLCSLCGANGIIGFLVNTLRQIHDVHEEVLIPFSPQLSEIVDEIYRNVARAQGHVLILGESGTGKELAARLIHRYSERANRPFLSFNCTAVPATLFDDAFFGHDKGSFTDANGPRKGYYESALGGTLFLDEIGDIGMECQAKLLRVIQFGEIQRIGHDHPITIPEEERPRLIFATNRDLKAMVEAGKFRDDLYQRLNRCTIRMPPLREMTEHLPVLLPYMIRRYAHRCATKVQRISQDALRVLQNYTWPGNIRELETVLQNALMTCEGETLRPRHLHLDAEQTLPAFEAYPTLLHLEEEIARNATSCEIPTLIEGEDGWERGIVARAIHQRAMRMGDPFVAIDASTLSPDEISSPSPGEKGCCFFPPLDRGTLFLDRVESLPPRCQRILLGHLDEWNMMHLGIIRGKPEVKWIFGTNTDLAGRVAAQAFDPELYQTIQIETIRIPPLWRRREVIPELVEYFLRSCYRQERIPEVTITPEAQELLERYAWPGQVREIRRVVEYLAMNVGSDRKIRVEDLPPWINPSATIPGRLELEIARIISETYLRSGKNKSKSAKRLQVDRRTVDKYLKIAERHGFFP